MDHMSYTVVDSRACLPKDRICNSKQIDYSTELSFEEVRCLVGNRYFTPPTNVFDKSYCVVNSEPYALLGLLYYVFFRVYLLVLILISVRPFRLEEGLFLLRVLVCCKKSMARHLEA